jgi:hypothetical protein
MKSPALFTRIDLLSTALCAGVAGLWFVRTDLLSALAVVAGTTIGVLNLAALRHLVRQLLTSDDASRPRLMAMLGAKFAALAVALFLLLNVVGLDAVAFGAGLTVVVLSLTVETLRTSLTPRLRADASQR